MWRYLLIVLVGLCANALPHRSGCGQEPPNPPAQAERQLAASGSWFDASSTAVDELPATGEYRVGYEDGFYIRPADPESNPFSMRINGRVQLRHTGLVRNVESWTDSAGVTRAVTPRNDFEIERLRFVFRGNFIDPKLGYFMQLDGDTDENHRVDVLDFWINYEFSEALVLHAGKGFVPGSRDWLHGDSRFRFADRSMATEFFRPDRDVGVWALGDLEENLHYRVMVSNAFRAQDVRSDQLDDRFAYAGSLWWDPLGDYGAAPMYSDLDWSESLVMRVGSSVSFARERAEDQAGLPLGEENFARLSDGTRLVEPGALAPGVTVNEFDVLLYALDGAGRYRGFSWNGEYFFRWISSLEGTGALPLSGFFDHGFYIDVGYFIVPERWELIARTSQIYGAFGTAFEYAGGVNWFLNGTNNLRLTIDVSRVIGVPIDASGANYRAGDDGVMLRTQFQAAF